LERIRSGEFGVGQWLPSEAELQREYSISQTPVRRALQELERAGFIRRHQGLGSIVVSREIAAVTRMIGLGAELRERGHEVVAKVLGDPTRVEAEPAVQEALALPAGAKALRLDRVFLVDGVPAVLFEHYLSPRVPIRPEQLAHASSLYQYLSEVGAPPDWADESITADLLSPARAEVLGRPAGIPVLVRRRTAYSASNLPIEFATYWICAENYSMALSLRSTFP
jgi:GntR family transcriptional regulator